MAFVCQEIKELLTYLLILSGYLATRQACYSVIKAAERAAIAVSVAGVSTGTSKAVSIASRNSHNIPDSRCWHH